MFAVMRCAKLKTMGQVGALGKHNERERETRNAAPDRLQENERLAGSGDWCADVQARLDTVPLVRTNAVLALEYVLTASREFFADGDPARVAAWRDASMDWIRGVYGAENVVAAVLHRDEVTPHIQAVVVPIDEQGRLSARSFINGAEKLHAQQTSYAHAVESLGLQRGVQGSVADHQTVQAFYAKIQEPTPAREEVLRAAAVDRPGRIVTNPEKWATEQEQRLAERLAPAVDAALVKARHFEEQAARSEANVVVLAARVQALEAAYKEHIAQARAADLRTVISALGGQLDRHDRHKWEMANGDHISITSGGKWYNHDQQQGGGGAIDLVRHVAGYDFTDAVAYWPMKVARSSPWPPLPSTGPTPRRRSWTGASGRPSRHPSPQRHAGRRYGPTSRGSVACRRDWWTSCTPGGRSTPTPGAMPCSCAPTRRATPWAPLCGARCPAQSSRAWPWAAGAMRGTSPSPRARRPPRRTAMPPRSISASRP